MRTKEYSVIYSGIHSVIVENLASAHLESWLIPDPYHFTVSPEGKLLFPGTEKPVEDYVAKDTPVQKAEYKALQIIQTAAHKNTFRYVLWVSAPKVEIGYELAKFTVSQLSTDKIGVKRLDNIAILNNFSAQECIKVVQKFTNIGYDDPELLRATPIFLDLPQGLSIIDFLSQHIPPKEAWEKIKTGVHQEEKDKARAIYAKEQFVDTETLRSGGANPNGRYSCPLGAYAVFLQHSRQEGWHTGNCRICKRNTEIGPCSICKECEPLTNSPLPLAA